MKRKIAMNQKPNTREAEYTQRLSSLQSVWWKQIIDVQLPYRWNVRRLKLGFTLDIGCGLGRNLLHLRGNGVGIDHNPASVEVARSRGLKAFLPDEFSRTDFNYENTFDSILVAHVIDAGEREPIRK
jgi:SAM-dependent methyltransferase